MVGDSAYKVTEHLIAPYKKPRNGYLSQDKKQFNKLLSRYVDYMLSYISQEDTKSKSRLRIRVEHTIGMLKARFACLRMLPNSSRMNPSKMEWSYAWIGACIVLHNLLLQFNDSWIPDEELVQEILLEEGRDCQRRRGDYGEDNLDDEDNFNNDNRKREELFSEFLRLREE